MLFDIPTSPTVTDRRARRSQSALLSAAVRLVGERGTTAVSATELAHEADVSRRVMYQHFGDRDGLLIAATANLVAQELLPRLSEDPYAPSTRLAVVGHFAEHRDFYRATLTGSCAYAAARTLNSLFRPFSIAMARRWYGDLDEQTVEDMADYLTGGSTMALTAWLVDGPAPLDVEEFAERLFRIQSALTGALPGHGPDTGGRR
ncbi:MAG: TetR/AcrR family transcriptional regulator [Actinomycetota bacterium]|nr:TetR/AcrR family transcriptional regulator [Actinomycetota bacterium]